MRFKIRKHGDKYVDVKVEEGSASIDLGLLFGAEVDTLAAELREAADEIAPKEDPVHDLVEALHEARRAIGDHNAPADCYATGPVTGDHYRDLVQCPACSAIDMFDSAIAKATGAA